VGCARCRTPDDSGSCRTLWRQRRVCRSTPTLLGLAGLDTIGNSYRQHTETYAGFLHGEWTFAPQWTLVGGVRFTDEHKKFDEATTFLGAGGVDSDVFAPTTNYFTTSNTPGKVGINYKVLDQTLLYASVSRGFKSGGFQGQLTFDPTALKPFKDECLPVIR
jgi:iron complex outermembrane recepter protein